MAAHLHARFTCRAPELPRARLRPGSHRDVRGHSPRRAGARCLTVAGRLDSASAPTSAAWPTRLPTVARTGPATPVAAAARSVPPSTIPISRAAGVARAASELAGELPNSTLLSRRHVRRWLTVAHLIWRPGSIERVLKLLERCGANGTTGTTKHRESDRPIELGKLIVRERACELLRQPETRDTDRAGIPALDVVIDRYVAPANHNGVGQGEPPRALRGR